MSVLEALAQPQEETNGRRRRMSEPRVSQAERRASRSTRSPRTSEEVPWVVLLEQISKANGRRVGNYVPRMMLPDWKNDSDSDCSEELPPSKPNTAKSAKEKAAKSTRRTAPSLEGLRWTVWSHVCRPFTPDNEVGTLKPRQLNLWEEKRVFSPNRSWPTQPTHRKLAASPEFYDLQRSGLPYWRAVSWKHNGTIFSTPPPFKKRPGTARVRQGPQAVASRPSSVEGKTRHPRAD